VKHWLAGMAAMGLLALPAHAAPSSDITATLKVFTWLNQQIISSTDKATERFKVRYPNVTIEAQYVPSENWGDYNNSFINQAVGGDIPDIFSVAIEGFAQSASTGLLLDLDALIENDPAAQEVLADIEENLINGMRTRPSGELNFFPTEWNNIVVYYNKDLFDVAGLEYPQSGWTWEEFRAIAKALTVRDAAGNATQYGYFVPGINFALTPWLYSNQAGVLDADWREPAVTTDAFRETLQFLHDLINKDRAAPAYESNIGDDKFVAGQVAMFSAGHWPLPEIIESGLDNVGVQVMPVNTAEPGITVYGTAGMAITTVAEHPDLAWEFIKEMTGKQFQQELADSGRSIPTSRTVATTKEWMAFPDNSEIFYDSAATAIPVAVPANFARVEEIFMRHVGAYLTNNQDLESTIDGLDFELTRAMTRANR
jgi:multiple sugar transport system substrate-binding protein